MQRGVFLSGLAILVMALVSCAPSTRPVGVPGEGALVVSRLYLDAQGPVRDDVPFLFGGREAVQASVALRSLSSSRLSVQVQCDGPARLRRAGRSGSAPGDRASAPVLVPVWAQAGTSLQAWLAPRARDRLILDIAPQVAGCTLNVNSPVAPGYAISLEREALARPRVTAREAPGRPGAPRQAAHRVAQGDALAAAFRASRPLAMTAPLDAGGLRLLADGTEALNARIEALTGSRVPEAVLASGDPTLPLDFSNAPQLDAIYLSYLILAADFSGALMARMLSWHAERGTVVRILASETLLLGPDRAFYEDLAARYPTVQLQPFRFAPRLGDGAEEQAARAHRSNHAKIFMTLARDPARSRAIIGGRNWQEAYLFAEPRDLSAFPALRQYFTGHGWSWLDFHPFEDIEVEFTAPDLIQGVAVQFAALWHRDNSTDRPFEWPPAVATTGSVQGQARHFLSVPWIDGRAQEALFIDLFDAARESIEIASPFVNLTPGIEAALERAVSRGVSVRLVTTMDRTGPDGWFIDYLHREFARDWADRIELHDFHEGNMVLHAKIFVFDRRLALITSTNLNQRSFFHDLENGLLVLDRQFAARSAALVDDYIARGQPVSDVQIRPGIVALLMRSHWLRRVF